MILIILLCSLILIFFVGFCYDYYISKVLPYFSKKYKNKNTESFVCSDFLYDIKNPDKCYQDKFWNDTNCEYGQTEECLNQYDRMNSLSVPSEAELIEAEQISEEYIDEEQVEIENIEIDYDNPEAIYTFSEAYDSICKFLDGRLSLNQASYNYLVNYAPTNEERISIDDINTNELPGLDELEAINSNQMELSLSKWVQLFINRLWKEIDEYDEIIETIDFNGESETRSNEIEEYNEQIVKRKNYIDTLLNSYRLTKMEDYLEVDAYNKQKMETFTEEDYLMNI